MLISHIKQHQSCVSLFKYALNPYSLIWKLMSRCQFRQINAIIHFPAAALVDIHSSEVSSLKFKLPKTKAIAGPNQLSRGHYLRFLTYCNSRYSQNNFVLITPYGIYMTLRECSNFFVLKRYDVYQRVCKSWSKNHRYQPLTDACGWFNSNAPACLFIEHSLICLSRRFWPLRRWL